MSDLPSRESGQYVTRTLTEAEIKEIVEAWRSGRLVDREAIDYGTAAALWSDISEYRVRELFAAAIGDTPSTITSADWFNRDDNI